MLKDADLAHEPTRHAIDETAGTLAFLMEMETTLRTEIVSAMPAVVGGYARGGNAGWGQARSLDAGRVQEEFSRRPSWMLPPAGTGLSPQGPVGGLEQMVVLNAKAMGEDTGIGTQVNESFFRADYILDHLVCLSYHSRDDLMHERTRKCDSVT